MASTLPSPFASPRATVSVCVEVVVPCSDDVTEAVVCVKADVEAVALLVAEAVLLVVA